MSKGHHSDDDTETQCNNKRPDHTFDSADDSSTYASISESKSLSATNQSSDLSVSTCPKDQSNNSKPISAPASAGTGQNAETITQTHVDEHTGDVNEEESESECDPDFQYEYGITQLSDYSIHFIDALNGRGTYHLHLYVLVLMTKFFETLFLHVDDNELSQCTISEKCQEREHRCLTWYDCEIGGTELYFARFSEFFSSMYAVADGSGPCQATFDEYRKKAYIFDCDPMLLRISRSLDTTKQQATFDC